MGSIRRTWSSSLRLGDMTGTLVVIISNYSVHLMSSINAMLLGC